MSASMPRQAANDDWDDDILFGGEEAELTTHYAGEKAQQASDRVKEEL